MTDFLQKGSLLERHFPPLARLALGLDVCPLKVKATFVNLAVDFPAPSRDPEALNVLVVHVGFLLAIVAYERTLP